MLRCLRLLSVTRFVIILMQLFLLIVLELFILLWRLLGLIFIMLIRFLMMVLRLFNLYGNLLIFDLRIFVLLDVLLIIRGLMVVGLIGDKLV